MRKYKKINFIKDSSVFISPCEGHLIVSLINKDNIYCFKGVKYHLSDLLKDNSLALEYIGGYLLVFRLKPVDYHRYIFIDDGIQKKENICFIKGKFHTINPIAFKYFNVFYENSREYNILHTINFGKVIQMEIGALLVSKINNHPIISFKKGQEKGYFSFGGSTIVLLLKKNVVFLENFILENSKKNIETKINLGDKIGTRYFN
ncbi:MAG: phosphatidylserine decarboxylase [Candidatus Phytoplasma stylosanthis]|nr:phosphatidylserine decarboxylase [Candidatus Phytoplasma stylosanthis]